MYHVAEKMLSLQDIKMTSGKINLRNSNLWVAVALVTLILNRKKKALKLEESASLVKLE